jgi:Predicted GTPases
MIARIIRIVSKEYTLLDEKGNRYDAILTGKIRMQMKPVAGDMVEAVHSDNRWIIESILPRRNKLIRPAVANIDQALIVMPSYRFKKFTVKSTVDVKGIDQNVTIQDVREAIRKAENARLDKSYALIQAHALRNVLSKKQELRDAGT